MNKTLKTVYTFINKPFIIYLGSAALCCSCKKEESSNINTTARDTITQTNTIPVKETPVSNADWKDELLKKYVLESESPLIAVSDRQKEQWLLDDTRVTDTATYFIYQIGHDVTDEGGKNPRFTTDQWVYIDSLSHQLYESDLVSGELIKWKK
jgi:hypothetical protein